MNNEHLAFGIDVSRWQYSPDGKVKLDFEKIALHEDNIVSFVYSRAGVSWGYQDPWFKRNWEETARIDEIRAENAVWDALFGIPPRPCGRGAYHVLYPGENVQNQVDNLFRIIGDDVDWKHDRLVIDAELDHGQSKRTITHAINEFANLCEARTGKYPILYSRTGWLNAYTYPKELAHLDMWLAQYRWPRPYPLMTPETLCPPDPLPISIDHWLIHQTASRQKPIGAPATNFMDYNRWNGDWDDVAKYHGHEDGEQPPTPVVVPSNALERLWAAVDKNTDWLIQ
jgi:GH25 family lysozyme M1 (1,4-beta-N-acetylmuramidase)